MSAVNRSGTVVHEGIGCTRQTEVGSNKPSSLVLNLCGCSEWNHDGKRSAVHNGWTKACLSLRWPMGCEALWRCLRVDISLNTKHILRERSRICDISHHWGAEWSLCVCRMDAPEPAWCKWQMHFGHWDLHLPSKREWGSPVLQIS